MEVTTKLVTNVDSVKSVETATARISMDWEDMTHNEISGHIVMDGVISGNTYIYNTMHDETMWLSFSGDLMDIEE